MERASADYFEEAAKGRDAKLAANWVINELFGRLNKEGLDVTRSPVSAQALGAIVDLISSNVISGKIAKDLFEIVWTEGGDPKEIVEARGMKQVTDTGAIEAAVDEVIAANPDKVAQAQAKPTMLGWFVGQVMKTTGGKANPQAVNDLLKSQARHLIIRASAPRKRITFAATLRDFEFARQPHDAKIERATSSSTDFFSSLRGAVNAHAPLALARAPIDARARAPMRVGARRVSLCLRACRRWRRARGDASFVLLMFSLS